MTRAGRPATAVRRARAAAACALLLLAALLGGCGLDRGLAVRADALVQASRPQALDCTRADHCAIDSPWQRLAARAAGEGSPDAPVHYVNLLERGEDALLLRVHLIRAARTRIDIQTFIWADDDAGWLVLDELVAAARRGVRVRVLVDQLFALDDVEWLARIARAHANFDLRLYNPTFDEAVTEPLEFAAGLLCCFSRFNQRMHNKLFLVDGRIGIVGGRNVEDRYFDWDPAFNYRDRDVLVAGPVAGSEMQASFDVFWSHPRAVPLTRLNDVNRRIVADGAVHATLQPPPGLDAQRVALLRARAADPAWLDRQLAAQALRTSRVEYFSDTPDKPSHPQGDPAAAALTARIGELLQGARRHIVMETPYLVLSRRARALFAELHDRTPRVRVTVSTNSLAATDAFYVYALSYKYKKLYLKRYGFEIHEFKPFPGDAAAFVAGHQQLAGSDNDAPLDRYGRAPLLHPGPRIGLHGKSIVIDDRVSLIGSHNFDPRSDDYNTESGLIIHDRAVALRLREAILHNAAPQNAWVIAPRRQPALVGGINNLIGDLSTALPLFDFWPFRYASSFQLKPGCEPSLPDDPGFYACHVDVGDFPEVDLPLKSIYTRIVTAFGAGLVGIL
jgi:phosphatidylserine/phosphatidylglycerophosphate/cardiolipin synthase-like enzyme